MLTIQGSEKINILSAFEEDNEVFEAEVQNARSKRDK